ncbi:GNAT family N-acetyltransferase [Pseudoalteromonas xiamenensis]|uniref:GNAT family N-acetyltransferase n=1 Tax=Pseudoalteromonas xiamenensis TaxID=882626 RepID=A0A975DG35_9GAMM|nr:GNAT family N-acetyltransferase [Pseudoalteromonas xiamenensis]QTH71206.1 GNAT family N-acetyltransferase [Pseudoalteromonas xiamenensis]
MAINLRDITKDNWVDMIDLEISKEQERFVALPSEAIAASKFYDHYINRGIYSGDKPVGFIQYYPNLGDGKPNEIFIDQLLIDVSVQGQGYGTEAIKLALEEIKQLKGFNSVSICCVEGHDVMKAFFERFDFNVVEQDEYDKTIMELHFA